MSSPPAKHWCRIVVVTEHDDHERIHRYPDIISQEAARWADRY